MSLEYSEAEEFRFIFLWLPLTLAGICAAAWAILWVFQ